MTVTIASNHRSSRPDDRKGAAQAVLVAAVEILEIGRPCQPMGPQVPGPQADPPGVERRLERFKILQGRRALLGPMGVRPSTVLLRLRHDRIHGAMFLFDLAAGAAERRAMPAKHQSPIHGGSKWHHAPPPRDTSIFTSSCDFKGSDFGGRAPVESHRAAALGSDGSFVQ
jgi:hypothetical protein